MNELINDDEDDEFENEENEADMEDYNEEDVENITDEEYQEEPDMEEYDSDEEASYKEEEAEYEKEVNLKGIKILFITKIFIEKSNNIKIATGRNDYVDRFGKHWHLLVRPKNEAALKRVLKQNWLRKTQKKITTIHYDCRCSKRRYHGRIDCKFRAVFLKGDFGLYTFGNHNHPLKERGILGLKINNGS